MMQMLVDNVVLCVLDVSRRVISLRGSDAEVDVSK